MAGDTTVVVVVVVVKADGIRNGSRRGVVGSKRRSQVGERNGRVGLVRPGVAARSNCRMGQSV